jgi:hemagglutinin protein hagB
MEIKELKKGQLQNMEHFQFASHVAALCDEANIEPVSAVLALVDKHHDRPPRQHFADRPQQAHGRIRGTLKARI